MRKFLAVVLMSLAAIGAYAWEPLATDTQSENTLVFTSPTDSVVTITPVPKQDAVIELARYSPKSTSFRQTKKSNLTKAPPAKSILTRSAREQITLASMNAKPANVAWSNLSHDEDDDEGIDDLDLHRSYSQPKVAKTNGQFDNDDDAVIDLPDHVKLRLLIARTKAVDAHILIQAGKNSVTTDTELSDAVKIRLCIARVRAVKAHSEKFGSA